MDQKSCEHLSPRAASRQALLRDRWSDRLAIYLGCFGRSCRVAIDPATYDRLFRRYVAPNAYDRSFLPMPKYLHNLFYLVRPLRLIRKYAARLTRSQPAVHGNEPG